MDKLNIYKKLCHSRKNMDRSRFDKCYYEEHHILPKWMGGSNDKSNLVLFTAREHYIAHYLLFLHYRDQPSSAAFHMMNNTINNNYRDSRKYQELREYQSKRFSGDNNPAKRPEVRKKISEKLSGKGNGMYGRTGSSNPFYGKTPTQEWKDMKMKLHGHPLVFRGVKYYSLRQAMRETGVSRWLIKKEINNERNINK